MSRMQGRKLTADSKLLGRSFHADRFETDTPKFGFVLFGGSGKTPEEYARRAETLVTAFDSALDALEKEGLRFAFVYVTAPADGMFARMAVADEARATWTRHVAEELVPLLLLPFASPLYVAGYSGGAQLALSGPHALDAVFGAGALGADGVPQDVDDGPGWKEPLALYYNVADAVFGKNRDAIRSLEERGVARAFRRQPGGHAMADYVGNGSFAGLVRRAARIL
jgi:hypothetical protein